MDALTKSISVVKVPQPESLTHVLRWWLRCCFILGLPLSKPTYGFRVKVFTMTVLIAELTIALVGLGFSTNKFITEFFGTVTLQLSKAFSYYNYFLMTGVVHAILVWKLDELRAVIWDMDQHITVDLKLKKFLQIATVTMLVFLIITQSFTSTFAALKALDEVHHCSKPWLFPYTFCWASLIIYPIITCYTITAFIIALGYQFKLLKEEIQSESFISWDKLYERHVELCILSGRLQQCFDLPLTVIMAGTLVTLCMNGFYMTDQLMSNNFSHLAMYTLFLLDACMRCVCLCMAADYLNDQAKSISLELARVDSKNQGTIQTKETVRRFAANVRNLEYLTTFSVGGFCQLGKPLLLGILAVVISYFVLLCQLKDNETGPCTKN